MEERGPLWALVGSCVFFKLFTVGLIIYLSPIGATILFMVVSNLLWIVGAVVLVAGPLLLYYRLVKVRARRRKLIEAEWNVEPPPAGSPEPRAASRL